jgi:hypothetical protein
MSAVTLEGIVEGGRIRLDSAVHLPEGARVYVVIPSVELKETTVHLHSPRLVRKEQVAEFKMDIRKS